MHSMSAICICISFNKSDLKLEKEIFAFPKTSYPNQPQKGTWELENHPRSLPRLARPRGSRTRSRCRGRSRQATCRGPAEPPRRRHGLPGPPHSDPSRVRAPRPGPNSCPPRTPPPRHVPCHVPRAASKRSARCAHLRPRVLTTPHELRPASTSSSRPRGPRRR